MRATPKTTAPFLLRCAAVYFGGYHTAVLRARPDELLFGQPRDGGLRPGGRRALHFGNNSGAITLSGASRSITVNKAFNIRLGILS